MTLRFAENRCAGTVGVGDYIMSQVAVVRSVCLSPKPPNPVHHAVRHNVSPREVAYFNCLATRSVYHGRGKNQRDHIIIYHNEDYNEQLSPRNAVLTVTPQGSRNSEKLVKLAKNVFFRIWRLSETGTRPCSE